MDIEKLKKIYKLVYQSPTMRRIIDNDTGEVYISKIVTDLTCGLEKGNNSGHYNFYVEKYHDITNIRTIILDYDGENSIKDLEYVSSKLRLNNIMHIIVNSTNKGYHLYILLPKPLNLQLKPNKNFNNRIFTNLILNLVGDSNTLDKANYGLYSNIRQLGSVHPKTGKVLRVEYAYTPYIDNEFRINKDYYNKPNDYFNKALVNSFSFIKYTDRINNIIKSRYREHNYSNNHIDLRDLFEGKSYDGGKSKWCKCPFHNDNNPSLHVYEKKAYCQVCGEIPFKKIKKYFNL